MIFTMLSTAAAAAEHVAAADRARPALQEAGDHGRHRRRRCEQQDRRRAPDVGAAGEGVGEVQPGGDVDVGPGDAVAIDREVGQGDGGLEPGGPGDRARW